MKQGPPNTRTRRPCKKDSPIGLHHTTKTAAIAGRVGTHVASTIVGGN